MRIDLLPESALVHAEHVRIGSQFDCFCGAASAAKVVGAFASFRAASSKSHSWPAPPCARTGAPLSWLPSVVDLPRKPLRRSCGCRTAAMVGGATRGYEGSQTAENRMVTQKLADRG
jgi:hypothetical protein